MSTITGVTNWWFNLSTACQSQGVAVNDAEAVEQADVQVLNDLTALLEARQVLIELNGAIAALPQMSVDMRLYLVGSLPNQENTTAFENYLSALRRLCPGDITAGDYQCPEFVIASGQPASVGDREGILARRRLYEAAATRLGAFEFSNETYALLIAQELAYQGTEMDSRKTTVALDAVVRQVAGYEEILDENITSEYTFFQGEPGRTATADETAQLLEAAQAMVLRHCEEGVVSQPVPVEPVVPSDQVPQVPETPVTPSEPPVELYAALDPYWAWLIAGDGSSVLPMGPGTCGDLGLFVNLPGDMVLEGGWEGCYDLRTMIPFTTDSSRDVYDLAFGWGQNGANRIHVAYEWERSYAINPDEDLDTHFWGAGYSRMFPLLENDALRLEPYASFMLGMDSADAMHYGGILGLRGRYELPVHVRFEGEAGLTYVYDENSTFIPRVSLGVSYFFSLPFLATEMQVGAEGFFAYDSRSGDMSTGGGIVLEWTGSDVSRPLPMPGEF
ncbi:MAG: hypothetical protein WCT39_04215 [Candidatus Margulisiibacteriota bacterium]